jgi:Animal haem peroxidase/Catalase
MAISTTHGDQTLNRSPRPAWSEQYDGGSPEQERVAFQALATDIMRVQMKNRKAARRHGVRHGIDRAFHVKATFAADDAELAFLDLPPDLEVGFARSSAVYPALVRFSNAAGTVRPDADKDMRGVALRVTTPEGEQHDLLATNFPVSHARNAEQFVRFAVATAGGRVSQIVGLAGLAVRCGPLETIRMLRNILDARCTIDSIATETYWSRGAIAWGDALAVRYLLRPEPGRPDAPPAARHNPDFLSHEAARRLAAGDMRFELCLQRFRDPKATPIEDTAVEWSEQSAPPIPVAVLTIRGRDAAGIGDVAEPVAAQSVDFNPWNTTEDFRPLGNLNRARKAAYDASAAHRHQHRWLTEPPGRNVVLGAAARSAFRLVNRFVPWHHLGVGLGLLNLDAIRYVLRRDNLIDTEQREAPPRTRPAPPAPPAEADRVRRSFNGTANDLSDPRMGAVGATFGRNLAPDFGPDPDQPNPYLVSEELLARHTFRPATSLNLLAAAWIQFQVHDWVHHERHRLGDRDVVVPLPEGVLWKNLPNGPEETRMRIADNISLADLRPGGSERVFANSVSHWWDASEAYGADDTTAQSLRDGAKLKLIDGKFLPRDARGLGATGFNNSWWLGLSGLHTLFAREHNLLCDELRRHYPRWSDDRVYHTARLIVAALIAKIHTVEWTPAILATDAIDLALKTNWNGPPAHDWLTRLGIWLMDAHSGVGIPKTMPDHHAAPYSLTEDFVTVYRLHPLLPDDYVFRSHATGEVLRRCGFDALQGDKAEPELQDLGLDNMLYSFGLSYPGAVTLHNYPNALRKLERDGERIDLSVVDVVRTRRRGIPRYNDFRAGLHKPRIRRWEDLCADPESVRRLQSVYRNIDEVDTMVGLFAETPPDGFGFSDTAFRIFILMASRRLQSDRFLTVDFRPEIYSPFGMDWIANNGMTSVILRHCPDLAAVLPRDATAFAPWRPRCTA